MKRQQSRVTLHVLAGLGLACAFALQAELMRYGARPGSKIKIDGDSTIHKWTVEGSLVSGAMELDPKIKIGEDSPDAAPGKVEATCAVSIPVTSLKSGKDLMDNIMYDAMKSTANPKIFYKLKELTLKDKPKAGAPVEFDSVGFLAVAGVTNEIAMPVKMEKTPEGLVKVNGLVKVKMTQFGITPPSPKITGGLIKTDDDVTLTVDWLTKPLGK
jgi:hypothetical protein